MLHSRKTLTLIGAAFLCLALHLPAAAQNLPGSIQRTPLGGALPPSSNGRQSTTLDDNPLDDEKTLNTLNADRQKALVSDTNKLIKLVNDLNAEIDRNHPESLTPPQVRKVAEIEKLAHNVKEKMSTSVKGTPAYQPPPVRLP